MGAGVGLRVVGPEAVGARDREMRKVPYLLASVTSGERPWDAVASSVEERSRLESVGASSSS